MSWKISSRAFARRSGRASLTTALVVAYALLNAGAACAQRTAKDTTTSNAQSGAVHSDTSTGAVESYTPLPAIHSRFAEIARRVTPAVVSISSEFSPEVAARMEGDQQQIPPGFLPPAFSRRECSNSPSRKARCAPPAPGSWSAATATS
jgi:hypothetical protein